MVPSAVTGYPGQNIYRNTRWRTAVLACTGPFYMGPNATGTSVTMALMPANTAVTVPLGPDEGIYGLGAATSVVSVLITGG